MTLKEHVLSQMQGNDEKLIEVSPFCYMRLMPDGSAILYKNNIAKIQWMCLSRHDLEFIKHMALPGEWNARYIAQEVDEVEGQRIASSMVSYMLYGPQRRYF